MRYCDKCAMEVEGDEKGNCEACGEYAKRVCKNAKCGKSLEGHRSNKIFCSSRCSERYHNINNYHKIKHTKAYKERRKTYEKSRVEQNREKWKKASKKYREKKALEEKND